MLKDLKSKRNPTTKQANKLKELEIKKRGYEYSFKFYGEGLVESIRFKIFNRLGKIVYQTNSLTSLKDIGWDGKFLDLDQPEGVYVWTLEADYLNGQPVQQKELITGTILLNH